MASPIRKSDEKNNLGIRISHAVIAVLLDVFLVTWPAQIAWNYVVPSVTHDRLGKLGYVDCLVLRLGMYCLFRAVFAEILVQNAMLQFYDTVNTFCTRSTPSI